MKLKICKQISVNFFGIFKRIRKKYIPYTQHGMIFASLAFWHGLTFVSARPHLRFGTASLTFSQIDTHAGLDDLCDLLQRLDTVFPIGQLFGDDGLDGLVAAG